MYQVHAQPVASVTPPKTGHGKTDQTCPLAFQTLEIYSALMEFAKVGDQRTLRALYQACQTPSHKIEDTCAAIAVMMSAIPFDYVDRRVKADAVEVTGKLLEERDRTIVVRPLETLQV
ncbi:MAG: hypothetical protein A3A61_01210 [Candidatus Woykebacteria bacterium RIFCSPLOWO2_01_FULL_43_14]|uniref:Uncharacterized protein n=1 Tax=Candidatus Woykebacteria bacterium RIFCSPLOWO2_01_FULL_43_14 TaxID=1802605 RepID=A0A1G1WWA9_9BACT|nr:MAG: hypothetical protein A3A61_01210 [Candidatus Woykebacteria bacterium RIFCSPLOWO2_01_FULL_43_14]